MAYKPKPIDTSGVTLTERLRKLTEELAENSHDLWAQRRIDEGWTYGAERNDSKKTHPDLVPYADLSESEKDYDRTTAMESLKTIAAKGYRIEAPEKDRTVARYPSIPDKDEEFAAAFHVLEDPNTDLGALLSLWQARNPDRWSRTLELYQWLGARLLKFGATIVGFDVVSEGLDLGPSDVRLRQLQALTLARSGATERARGILEGLRDEGHLDEETLGMLARLHKDLWATARDPAERERHLCDATKAYNEAYQKTGGYWTGINAATMAMLLGEKARARGLARKVRDQCLREIKKKKVTAGDAYWPLATLGEAALVLGEFKEAEDRYCQAAEVGHGKFGELNSTLRQARLLIEYLGVEGEHIERCLRIPKVVVFAGHMIDRPERTPSRFPPQLEQAVSKAIRDQLTKLDGCIGYSSAACGSDILFQEAILELKGEAHVVLPYDRDQFMKDSVAFISGADWASRYERVLNAATEMQIASAQRLAAGTINYEHANILLHGLASIRANQIETELVPLAVWDGRAGDGPGGTQSVVERWQGLRHEVEIVNIAELLRTEFPELAVTSDTSTPLPRPTIPQVPFPPEIKAILFADAVGFGKLTEEEIPLFVQHFLGAIAELVDKSPHAPVGKNTWGDGLYFVFSGARDAGRFALDLCGLVRNTDWAAKGLPATLGLRIALNAGPVYSCINPITGQPDTIGTNVSRAARIEPITPPGQDYAR